MVDTDVAIAFAVVAAWMASSIASRVRWIAVGAMLECTCSGATAYTVHKQ
jgi:hypothetical protein